MRNTLTKALVLLSAALTMAEAQTQDSPLLVTHGVAAGDVTASSVVFWSRSTEAAEMQVEVGRLDSDEIVATGRSASSRSTDYTAQVFIDGLEPHTAYRHRIWFETSDGRQSDTEHGSFRTAPAATDPQAIAFVFSGDLGGQRYCRRADRGYDIFARMEELRPDFFVANGDMIYADNDCPERGFEEDWINIPGDFPGVSAANVDWNDYESLRSAFLGHWRYNRADPHYQSFARRVPMIVQWDDHEVINDFGAAWPSLTAAEDRAGYGNLVRAGLTSFFDFHPIRRSSEEPYRIYRSFHWGRAADLIVLDARSYRSLNTLPDDPASAKTMLGEAQLAWLLETLKSSQATWKIVSSDVPLSVPTGSRAEVYGSDAWAGGARDAFSAATGFERELAKIIRFLDQNEVRNVVFITTDVHFAAQIRYGIDADGDGDQVVFHELIAGPLNAIRAQTPAQLDASLHPVLLYGEGNIFNFGYVRIELKSDGLLHLTADVRDDHGTVRAGSELDLSPR